MCSSDEELVRLCLEGQTEEFRHLVLRYEVPLLKYLVGRMGNEVDATEAAQEAMVRAFFNLQSLKKTESFFAWLMGIANRVAQEGHRKNQRHCKSIDIEAVADKTDPRVDQRFCTDQELAQAVNELPDLYKQVVLLRFYANQSCADISRSLNVSLGTVTSQLSRAYSLIRKSLKNSKAYEQYPEVEP